MNCIAQRISVNPVRNEDGIISVPLEESNPEPRGLGWAIFDKMKKFKEEIVQIDGSTGEEDTYHSLLTRCIRTAIVMRSKGVCSEDIVTVCSYNSLDSCVPYVAALFLCAKVTYIDPSNSLSDATHLLQKVEPKNIFVSEGAVQLIKDAVEESQIVTEIVVIGNSTEYSKFSEYLEPSEEEKNFLPVPVNNLKDVAIIHFSAGTTGMPKGVCMSHHALLDQGRNVIPADQEIEKRLNCLIFTSLSWNSTLTVLLVCLLTKRTLFVFSKFSVKQLWCLIEKNKISMLFLNAYLLNKVCKKGRRPRSVEIASLENVIITGSPISKSQLLELKNFLPGINITNVYGNAEAGGYVMGFRPSVFSEDERLLNAKPHSSGRPRKGVACKVVDNETGEILGPHQRGELRIKSKFQMNGYYGADSSAAWDSEGWLKSGDIAYYDEDNCFYLVDRLKEMLKFRAWHVAPSKLESILRAHPAVETAVVVGLPHPEDGEHPVGVVVLRKSAGDTVTAEDIEFYVDQRVVDRYRLRGGIRIVGHIPVTPTGSYRRRDIRDLVLQGKI